jgi:hypothetical protein
MTQTGENRSTWRKTCHSTILHNRNPRWTGLGLNPGFRGDTPANNRLNRDTTPRRWTVSRTPVKFLMLRTVCIMIFVDA